MLSCMLSAQSIRFERYDEKMGYSGGGNYGSSTIIQDRRGFIWMATISGLNRFDGHRFQVFQYEHSGQAGLSSNEVTALAEDRSGNIWIGTAGGGLSRFDPTTESFTSYRNIPGDTSSLKSNYINHLLIDRQDRLWIGHRFDGLDLFLPDEKSFKHFTLREEPDTLNYVQGIIHLAEDTHGMIWLAANAGLFKFDPERASFQAYYRSHAGADRYKDPREIYLDRQGNLWVSVHFRGLARVNEVTQQLDFSDCQLLNQNGAPEYLIEAMIEDELGNFWVGSQNALYYLDPGDCSFSRFDHDPRQTESLLPGGVMDIFEDRQGNIWLMNWAQRAINKFNPHQNTPRPLVPLELNDMTTVDHQTFLLATARKLWRYELEKGRLSPAIPNNHLDAFKVHDKSSIYITELLMDQTGKYLVGTFAGGLYIIDPKTGRITHHLGEQSVNKMVTLHDQRIFIATSRGVMAYFPRTGVLDEFPTFRKKPILQQKQYTYIAQDRQLNLWLATAYEGVYFFDWENDTVFQFQHQRESPNSLSANLVRCIFEDQDGKIWFCTDAGLDAYDPVSKNFSHYSGKDGIPESFSINAITQDAAGFLWLTTPNYLLQFDPVSGSSRKILEMDAFSIIDVPPRFHHLNDSTIYFSARSGLSRVNTKMDSRENDILNVVLTDFKLFNKTVAVGGADALLTQHIAHTDRIELNHRQNSISLSYQGISFTEPELINFAYKLEGFDEDWQVVGSKNEATYTNLSSGYYTFYVKSRYQNGPWSAQTGGLQLYIGLPWWKTPLALLGWIVLFLTCAYVVYRLLLKRQLMLAEANRLKEIDAFKSQLYTSITHEFRTPITVILGISERLKETWHRLSPTGAEKQLNMIERNGRGLLKLVNQMLDLSRIEADKMELNWISGEITAYLSYLLEAMNSLAQSKKIVLEKKIEVEELRMDYDPDKLQIVLSNLLTNAIKFTPPEGRVSLSVKVIAHAEERNDQLQIVIRDNGIGMEETDLKKIFQPFYQINGGDQHVGTGIGLSITKGLVELMGGEISVDSRPGQYSQFVVLLPIRQQASLPAGRILADDNPQAIPVVAQEEGSFAGSSGGSDLPILLVIEDNDDLILYLQECLREHYQILIAKDGAAGIAKALQTIPDAIVSDVMMPKKNGYEVCRKLKNDERTSHIPIILLTAKATVNDRLSGLERGADAYLIKPFLKRELLIRLQQLVALRKTLKKRYTGEDLARKRGNALEQVEDAFISKVNKVILDHLNEEDFDSARLCQVLLISNTQLYRKLKALTGESIAVYIRSVRLHQARQLLVETDQKISEIAYRVGFKDLSYFSKCFVKKFAVSPQNFRKNINA